MRSVAVVFLFLVSFVGLAGTQSPEELLAASAAALRNLPAGTFRLFVSWGEATVHFAYPFTRWEFVDEREPEEEEISAPHVILVNHALGQAWVLYTTGVWVEVTDERYKDFGPLSLVSFPIPNLSWSWHGVTEKDLDGSPVYVLTGTADPDSLAVELWLEKETLWPRGLALREPRLDLSQELVVHVEDFETLAGLPPELFEPPAPAQIARRVSVVPAGYTVLQRAKKELEGVRTFRIQRRLTLHGFRDDEVVYYRFPFLRAETWSQVLRRIIDVTVFHLAEGALYFYSPGLNEWEKLDLSPGYGSHEEAFPFVLWSVFGLPLLPYFIPIGLGEVIVGGRQALHVTGWNPFLPERPDWAWWIDAETYLVLAYVEPVLFPDGTGALGRAPRWQLRRVEITDFQRDLELPPELFAVPADVPVRRPLGELLEEPRREARKEAGEALAFVPFTQAQFEEAKSAGKTILLYFSADWCGPCRALEAKAFRDPQVQELLAPLARLEVDLTVRRGETKQIADQYRVRGVPTLLFLGPDGTEIGRITGYSSTRDLLQRIRDILGGERQ